MVEQLSKETFKEKVFDFEDHSAWNYEGDLPCVIDFYADWLRPLQDGGPDHGRAITGIRRKSPFL
jgi:hypothetical protein